MKLMPRARGPAEEDNNGQESDKMLARDQAVFELHVIMPVPPIRN